MRYFKWRAVSVIAGALMLAAAFGFTAYGYESSDKAIKSIGMTVTGAIEVDTKMGEEELSINTSGNKYSFDHYEVQNEGFRWSIEDTPVIKIYLAAEEGYYFRITKASQIRLNGATYVSAAREDGAYTLVVEVKLPSLETQVGDIENVTLQGGVCTWTEAIGAGSYEVKFMRNGTTLGGNQIVTGTSYDGTRFMTKSASYHCMVRALNFKDAGIKGHWTDSNYVNVTEAQARARKEANAEERSAGTWIEEDGRWCFQLPNGEYVASSWRQINDRWYIFDENGWMRTGWYLDGGKWYYLDLDTGAMWRNAVTPDGYTVGIDGVMEMGNNGVAAPEH